MTGETSLETLLKSLSVELLDDIFVFATIASETMPPEISPRMTFHEAEDLTVILTRTDAEAHHIPYEFPCRMITLNVHSSLQAVGFIAHVSGELAKHGMSVNPVSGFFHDHLFVPLGAEHEAMKIFADISRDASV